MREQKGGRRAWQPTGRDAEAGGGAAGVNTQDSSGSGTAKTTDPEEAKSSRSEEDDPIPPHPWNTWLQRRKEHEGQFPRFQRGHDHQTYATSRPFRRESVSGYDSSGGRRASGGWLSDGELRNFNVAQVHRMSVMNNGRWAGSYDEPYYQDRGARLVPFGEGRDLKPTEKISVPEFSGEGINDTEIGKSARSYIRKVQVWLRCTRLPHDQRALALYSALTERAWVYAEELDMDILSTENGVDYFLEWIQTRFMEVEMSKISQMMNDLFRRCKKRPDQTVRDFNVEFERMVLRLHEVRCELPPLVKAWLYVDKLRLTESQELSLLASCNNEFDCRRLQQAALIQDRSLRNGFGGSSTGPSTRTRVGEGNGSNQFT